MIFYVCVSHVLYSFMSLERRGHKIIPTDFLGSVQAVAIDLETDSLTAVSDISKQGMPAGY